MINVRHYSIEDGLSQNIVQDMLQDNDGYIWLATWNGLEKFDGYTFKNYKSYPTDDTKLKYNRLVSIVKGADDALWCHTYDDKVYLFDVRQENLMIFCLSSTDRGMQVGRENDSIDKWDHMDNSF